MDGYRRKESRNRFVTNKESNRREDDGAGKSRQVTELPIPNTKRESVVCLRAYV